MGLFGDVLLVVHTDSAVMGVDSCSLTAGVDVLTDVQTDDALMAADSHSFTDSWGCLVMS